MPQLLMAAGERKITCSAHLRDSPRSEETPSGPCKTVMVLSTMHRRCWTTADPPPWLSTLCLHTSTVHCWNL